MHKYSSTFREGTDMKNNHIIYYNDKLDNTVDIIQNVGRILQNTNLDMSSDQQYIKGHDSETKIIQQCGRILGGRTFRSKI